jgi:hypothetical protein
MSGRRYGTILTSILFMLPFSVIPWLGLVIFALLSALLFWVLSERTKVTQRAALSRNAFLLWIAGGPSLQGFVLNGETRVLPDYFFHIFGGGFVFGLGFGTLLAFMLVDNSFLHDKT